MARQPRVAVIGDFSKRNETHRATNAELSAAGASFAWLPTNAMHHVAETLRDVDAVWISPGSPYASMDGALTAIRHARERGIPLVGT
jgi:CTP synthase (UTP-ammonia lyase)